MPFCPQCGKQVSPNDRFCGHCGAPQPLASGTGSTFSQSTAGSSGISPRTASSLCYIPFFGWVVALFILASEKFRREDVARFHAFQGLYLFVAWLLIDLILDFIHMGPFSFFPLERLAKLVMIGTWIYMLIQTHQDRIIKLPFLSELADRSVSEQK